MNSAPRMLQAPTTFCPESKQSCRDTKPALPAFCHSSLPPVAVSLLPPAIQDATCGAQDTHGAWLPAPSCPP